MLSTTTTSENFPFTNQSKCSRSAYKKVIQSSYLSNILLENPQIVAIDENAINRRQLIHNATMENNGKIAPRICHHTTDSKKEQNHFFDVSKKVNGSNSRKENNFLTMEVPKTELENELTDLLEQLEVEDNFYEHSKPLKIDPDVLKLDFSKLTIKKDCGTLDKFYLTNFSEIKRASHHLSGGGLLTDASQEDYSNPANDLPKNHFCKLSGGGLVTSENDFKFKDLSEVDFCSSGISNFLNQISPSSPLTFKLTSQNEKEKNNSEISFEAESTNPFKNLMKGALEDENSFLSTNPFSDFSRSSSLNEIPNINCTPYRYENVTAPQKSFSQCSTRPVSPVLKTSEEILLSNPFLINETSPEQYPSAVSPLFVNDSDFHNRTTTLSNSSSFIFAVPVFPLIQNKITNSSTQTGDLSEISISKEPVYQNITNQLRKFIKRNDHSEYDLQCLKATVKDLRNSGWYYENVSWQESVVLLTDTAPGTFLIRDSSDPNFLFSLSVQTSRGPTSVRLHYVNGQFRLDAEKKLIPHMPSFNSVMELIDYYVENTVKDKSNNKINKVAQKPGKYKLQKSKNQVWIDSQGNIYSNILLVKPLHKKEYFSTLQHLTRLTINKCIKKKLNAKFKFNFRVTPVYESSPFQDSSFYNSFDNFCPILSIDALPLPSKLLDYLKDYPYCH